MKIKNITIENFRSAKDISINLLDNLNVLVGINGAGKTTILEALSISLSWLVKRIQRPSALGNSISDSDIRYDSAYSTIKITCEENGRNFSWKLAKGARGKAIDIKSELTEVSELAFYFQQILEKEEQLPVIAYYPVTRTVNKISPEISSKDNLFILDVYENALGVHQNFHSFFEWFRLQDDIVNEKAVSRTKWIQQNRVLIKRHVNNIIGVIKGLSPKVDFDKEEFEYLTRRINKDEFIYEEPRFLFHEFSRLIDFTNARLKHQHESIFHDLEYMFHKMERYSRNSQDSLIATEGEYKELVMTIIKDFNLFFRKKNIDTEITKIIWEIFLFANILSLWWLSDVGRRNLEKVFRNSYFNIIEKGQHWLLVSENLIDSLNLILKKEFQQKRSAFKSGGKELKIVTEAIEQFIPEYSSLRVQRVPRARMVINKGKEEFDLNQLSDGEKNLITLVGDIARRLAIANPHSHEPLKGNGIILIDEIDLHLHPNWQRIMIPQLLKVFPNCQFIVSTHSPQVLNHTKPDSLFLLEQKTKSLTYKKVDEIYGMSIERVVELVMDGEARPISVQEKLDSIFRLIEREKFQDAKIIISELKEDMKTDPEIMRAEMLIRKQEMRR